MLDKAKPVDVVYLDFAKAFDSVPHEGLLQKLFAYGISGNLLSWIRAFLTGRTQRVLLMASSQAGRVLEVGYLKGVY